MNRFKNDTYHYLLTCRWPILFCIFFGMYVLLNLVFSLIYISSTTSFHIPDHLRPYHPLVSGFFMSVQTMSTIGYGGAIPTSLYGELVATLESLVGLVFTALSTGLTFARLSQPTAQILFSDVFLYSETDKGPALIFRVANARGNDIIEAKATLSMINLGKFTEKLKVVDIRNLKLRREQNPTFYLNWMLIHDLDENSPLFNLTRAELSDSNLIFFLNITGHDSSFNQTIYQYRRYKGTECKHNAYFKDMIFVDENGESQINLENLSELK